MAGKECDLLVRNGTVVTMDRGMNIVENGSVAVRDGRILSVGPGRRLLSDFEPLEVVDAHGGIVMPGLVNTHTHSAMALFRGYADDYPLREWLERYMWPLERKFISPRFIRAGARLAICEMLRSGTTTFNDMYIFQDELAGVASEAGIRAVAGELIFEFPTACIPSPGEGMKHVGNMAGKWKGHPLVTVAAAPHSPYTCSAEVFSNFRELTNRHGLQMHVHLSETAEEVRESRKRHGVTPVRYMHDIGALEGRTVAAHCVHLTSDDIRILAKSGTGVSHNPESNMKLASGVAPVPDMLSAGVRVGLGTDGAASNNNLDLFGEISSASRLHKVFSKDPTAVGAKAALEMATLGGARALGMEQEIGSLEKGKRADIIILDCAQPHATPLYNHYSHLAYSMSGHDVRTVIVEGRVVMRERELLTLDEQKVMKRALEFGQKIAYWKP
jgi:5-methylthioadenosine/S-adenosylhomocysteine deaminase